MKNLIKLFFCVFPLISLSQTYNRDFSWKVPFQNNTTNLKYAHDPVHHRVFMTGMGDFAQECWPKFLKTSATNFQSFGNRLDYDGEIMAVEPDGNGGYFIAGNFTKINGQVRTYLAQIDANNNLLPFNPTITYFFPPNARISTLKVYNNLLYIGGGISTVNGQSRWNFAAFDIPSGVLLPWAPNPNGNVNSIEVADSKLFIGGNFTSIANETRNNLAAFDLNNVILPWAPNPDQYVNTIKSLNGKLYILGLFSIFDNTNHSRIVEVDPANLSTSSTFNFGTVSGAFFDIAFTDNKFFMVGEFSQVNGSSAKNCMIYNTLNNQIDLSSIQSDSVIWSIASSSSSVFIGGYFTTINNQPISRFAEYNCLTNTITDQQLSLNGRVNKLICDNNNILVFGNFNSAFQEPTQELNCYNDQTGQAINSPVTVTGTINNLSIDGRYLSLLGDLQSVNGQQRDVLAIYDLQADSLLDFNPTSWQVSVNSPNLQIINNSLLVEGAGYSQHPILCYPIFNDDSLRYIAEVSWDAYSSFGGINSFKAYDSLLLISGIFNYLNGQTRASFGMVNLNTGNVHPLDLGLEYNAGGGYIYPGHSMSDALIHGDTLYLAGQFDYSNGVPLVGLVQVNLQSNQLTQLLNTSTAGFDLDLSFDLLRICSIFGTIEKNISNNSLNFNTGILNNINAHRTSQLGGKIFAVSWNDFGVYQTCLNSSVSTINTTACSYNWNGNLYHNTGIYSHNVISTVGCDSTAYLNLSLENSESYYYGHICDTSFTSTQGNQYNQNGLFFETYTNVFGCDSVVALNLHFYPTYDTTFVIVSSVNPYNWTQAGMQITQNGLYSHTFQTINGCDSIVHYQVNFVNEFPISISQINEFPDGQLQCVYADELSQKVLVGGDFNGFNLKAELLNQIIDEQNFNCVLSADSVYEEINSPNVFISNVYPDAANGYYIQGSFSHIGDSIRNGIARLDSLFHVTSWQTSIPFVSNVMASDAQYLYVFKSGFPQDSLYKIDHLTGQATALNCVKNYNESVYSMECSSGTLLISGYFVGGGTFGILNYNIASNSTTKVGVSLNGFVAKVRIDGNKVYAAGSFTTIKGSARTNLARFTLNAGVLSLDSWFPNPNSTVWDICVTPTKVIFTGEFYLINGQLRNGTASYNKSSGTLTTFDPGVNLGKPILYNDIIIFSFNQNNVNIGGQIRNYFAAFDTTTFSLQSFDLKPDQQANFFVSSNLLFSYGSNKICYQPCSALTYYDSNSDNRISGPIILPQFSQIQKIVKVEDNYYFNGFLSDTINGLNLSVFSYNSTTGVYHPFPDPIIAGNIVGADSNFIYLNNAQVLSGTVLPNLSRWNVTTEQFDNSFSFNLGGNYGEVINDIDFDANSIYVVGIFDTINGEVRNNHAKINRITNTVESFIFDIDTTIILNNIEVDGTHLFIHGVFNALTPNSSANIGRIDKLSGVAQDWVVPNNNYGTNSLSKNGFNYLFGYFNTIDLNERKMFTVFEENSTFPYLISYDSTAFANTPVQCTIDLDVIENDIYGIFSYYGGSLYRAHHICRNDSLENIDTVLVQPFFTWFNETLTQSGTYYQNVPNSNGCDSLYILNLNMFDDFIIYDSISIQSCNNYYWNQNGLVYYNSGNFSDTIFEIDGSIDSVYYLNLTINSQDSITQTVSACDSFVWINGITYYTSTNSPFVVLSNSNGCDSVIYLNLTINQSTITIDTIISCQPITWINGITYSSSTNQPTFVFTNSFGCDSIVQLDFTLLNNVQTELTNSFVLPSDSINCTGLVSFDFSGLSPYSIEIDGVTSFNSIDSTGAIPNLCPDIHSINVIGACSDTLNFQFNIPIESNFTFNNSYQDSIALDSLGLIETNCIIDLSTILSADIDSIWMVGNNAFVIWNIVGVNGSYFDTVNYEINNGSGVYWLQLSLQCQNKSIVQSFTMTEAVYINFSSLEVSEENNENVQLKIFPNPTNDLIYIDFPFDQINLEITDASGKVIKQIKVKKGDTISMGNINPGFYFFDIMHDKGNCVFTVIKE